MESARPEFRLLPIREVVKLVGVFSPANLQADEARISEAGSRFGAGAGMA